MKKTEFFLFAFPLFLGVAFLFLFSCLTGCALEKPACMVIKVADDVCTVVQYVGADGKVHQESVSSSDLAGLAQASANRRLRDAGANSSVSP